MHVPAERCPLCCIVLHIALHCNAVAPLRPHQRHLHVFTASDTGPVFAEDVELWWCVAGVMQGMQGKRRSPTVSSAPSPFTSIACAQRIERLL